MPNLRLPPEPGQTSSYLNSGTWKGALIGGVIAGVSSLGIGAPLGALVGGAIGSFVSKRTQDDEIANGAIAKEPSFFNSTAILGIAVGLGLTLASGFIPVVGPMIVAAGLPTMLAIGAAAGSFLGKTQMDAEYATAQQYQASKAQTAAAYSAAPSPYQVTPEQMAAMNAAHAAGRGGAPVGQFTSAMSGPSGQAQAVNRS